jgi:hypothetical protein
VWEIREVLHLDDALGGDLELVVDAGDAEVVDGVAEEVAVVVDLGFGGDRELVVEAALLGFGAGVHAEFHEALADGGGVLEAGEVTDAIEHG